MEILEVDALCVRAIDFKENDKIINLYATEKGKISVVARGCKKPKAKLKFAASPLCFGRYHLAKRGDMYSLVGCDSYESFFDLAQDPVKYYAACVVLEVLDKLGLEDEYTSDFFVFSLKTLRDLCYKDVDVKKEMFTYLNSIVTVLGYKVNAITFSDFYNYFSNTLEVRVNSLKEFVQML